ncbi:thyroglobulin type-1 repeat-containing domain protein [Necator americanus]|uniref:Thyroglobulin type-1 repeat-containing domain protein n=1 Tax=Necator americanus TaxID=51031 RepID=W2T3W1_NECAM|nr:thyroglobulin type-1 repeat-containing domain protein [Necator americanus]ETN76239.1 thyroglobulin type-1 repeat-containing domain protein [Necator americanus]
MLDIVERRTPSLNGENDKVRLDCNVQRKKSLLKKSNGDMAIYVPTCSPTDSVFYLPVQCLEAQKYCWCVHTATGEPIPGTSILNAKPHCEEEKPTPKSKRIRKNSSTASDNVGRDAALMWKFDKLNTNKNQVLERSEWKPYKNALLQWKKVKHCSRNFFKTCDVDSNRRLTFEEWRKCIVKDITKAPTLRPDQLNPFLYILKAD